MTTIDTSPETIGTETADASGSFLTGVAEWATTSDHKCIGRLFLGTGLLALIATAVVGVLLGIERIDGGQLVFDSTAVSQMFQAHRVGLVFATMLPLGIGLAVAAVPLQLGARSLAFPRAALAGFYGWLAGLVLTVFALVNDGGVAGADLDMVVLFLMGHALMAIGLLGAAGSVATSVLTTRAPGMTMRRVPFFAWSALVAAIGMLIALPVLVGTVIATTIDLRNEGAVFGGAGGPGAWVGWAFTVPTLLVFAIPALGVFAETAPVAFRAAQRGRGVVFAGLALVTVAALAAVTQQAVFSVPWAGDLGDDVRDLVPFAMFHLLPILGIVIVLALGLLTGLVGKLRITSPLLFSFFGLGMIFVGALGGALYPIDDLGLRGTVFEEGAVVYVAYGTVLGVLGGIVHWAPKLWGRRLPELPAIGLALLGVVATILASLPYYVAGVAEQPAASPVFSYSGPDSLWNGLVLAGHGLMLLVVLGVVVLMLATFLRDGDPAGDDPWQGHTIEWSAPSPAPANNFAEVPVVRSAEPMLDLQSDSTDGSRS